MAEESDLERTEPASDRKLQQAREQGNVPSSRELGSFFVLLFAAAIIWTLGGWLAQRLGGLLHAGLRFERQDAFEPTAMVEQLSRLGQEGLIVISPLLLGVVLAALAPHAVLKSWVFTGKALVPDFTRLNPIKGLSRIISVNGVAELVKAVLKVLLLGALATWMIWGQRDEVIALLSGSLESGMSTGARMVSYSLLVMTSGLLLLAAIDVPFQLWQYHSKLKMTKDEVRREHKEQEGDPHVKARIRQLQQEMARRRMMSEVPKASVVVTNPTHYAVALAYKEGQRAPVVVAKGMNEVAMKIRDIATEHGVPRLEAPPLARALHKHVDLEEEIPSTLYVAVAEVLAYVYQLNHARAVGGALPVPPASLPVPEGLDPGRIE